MLNLSIASAAGPFLDHRLCDLIVVVDPAEPAARLWDVAGA
jgi:hypothetical protein